MKTNDLQYGMDVPGENNVVIESSFRALGDEKSATHHNNDNLKKTDQSYDWAPVYGACETGLSCVTSLLAISGDWAPVYEACETGLNCVTSLLAIAGFVGMVVAQLLRLEILEKIKQINYHTGCSPVSDCSSVASIAGGICGEPSKQMCAMVPDLNVMTDWLKISALVLAVSCIFVVRRNCSPYNFFCHHVGSSRPVSDACRKRNEEIRKSEEEELQNHRRRAEEVSKSYGDYGNERQATELAPMPKSIASL